MKNKNISNPKIENLFKAKELYHKQLAKIPFEEKIKILVQLQKIAHNIGRVSKKKQRVWKI